VIKIIIPLVYLFSIGCKDISKSNEDIETHAIVSLLIDKYAKPIVPPPSPNLSDSTFNAKSDSIKKILENKDYLNLPLIVCIDTILTPFRGKIEDISNFNTILTKLDKLESNKILNINKIEPTRKVQIHSFNTNVDDFKKNEIDMILSFSNIAYNENITEAALIFGLSRGRLSGFTSLIILKKNKGKWEIILTKNLSIS
tara:strand:- start:276528 stop:277124 length:597 start_codon:yes stop_codon:yes gene_type:complete